MVSNTVAAERGTVRRKKERSRTRIARLTGGRNISVVFGVSAAPPAVVVAVGVEFGSIGLLISFLCAKINLGLGRSTIDKRKKAKSAKGSSGLEK